MADVKTSKHMTGKSIHSQVVFYFNDEKVVLHCYNTTQLILVNGVGYKNQVELFLRSFFQEKVIFCKIQ